MKARIPRPDKEKRIVASTKSKNFVIELGRPITEVDDKVKNIYDELIEKYGRRRRLDIVEYMRHPEFTNLFSPSTPLIRKKISESVSKLGEAVIVEDLEETVQNMRRDYNFTLEKVVTTMKDKEFPLRLKKLVPHSLASIAEKAAIKFIEEKEEELKKKQEAKKQEKLLSSKDEKESAKQVVEDEKVTKKKEPSKEQQFFERTSRYTNGFKFLSKDRQEYISETGFFEADESKVGKFKDLEEYTRFRTLQSRVRKEMSILRADESKAIKAILKELEKAEKPENAELNILKARQAVLYKAITNNVNPDEQEM